MKLESGLAAQHQTHEFWNHIVRLSLNVSLVDFVYLLANGPQFDSIPGIKHAGLVGASNHEIFALGEE